VAPASADEEGASPRGAEQGAGGSSSAAPAASTATVEPPKTQQWESLFHLMASVFLARRFSARVVSLPKTTDRGTKWGNPDMLMVRSNALQAMEPFLRSAGIDVERFALVDDSPRAILSSVELKVGLGTNRALWFQAVAETAANSLWANEAWLVYTEPDGRDQSPDREVLALARSAEVGILEIVLREDEAGQASFDCVEHRAAPLRSRLRVGDVDAEQRIGLLTAAFELLGELETEGTFLDADGDAHKARLLLEQGLENLAAQVGFGRERSLAEATQAVRAGRPTWYRSLVCAALAEVEELVTVPSARGTWRDIDDAIRERVAYAQAEWLQSAIATLKRDGGGVGHALGPAQQQRKLRGATPSRGRAASSLRSSTCKSRPPVLVPQAPNLARSHTARYFLLCCAGPYGDSTTSSIHPWASLPARITRARDIVPTRSVGSTSTQVPRRTSVFWLSSAACFDRLLRLPERVCHCHVTS
jgi:hypothetical protein